MPPAFVQEATLAELGGSQNPTMAFSSNVTAGNTIMGFIRWADNTITLNSIDDNNGNGTYTLLDNPTAQASNHVGASYYVKNANGGATTVTYHFSASVPSGTNAILREVSGLDTTAPLDQHNITGIANPGTGTDVIVGTSVTTGANGEYIFGACRSKFGTASTAGSAFTQRQATGGTASEDTIQSTAGSISVKFSTSVGDDWLVSTMTFKVPAAAAGPGTTAGGTAQSFAIKLNYPY